MVGKPKIAHLSSYHPPYDTRVFYREIQTIARAGYEVVLVAPWGQSETVDGVRVRAVLQTESRSGILFRTVWQVLRAAMEEDAAVYHFHDPELIPIALLLKLHGKRVIYDVHEDVPRQLKTWYWIPRLLRGSAAVGVGIAEAVAAAAFDGIVAATPTIAARFPAKKTAIVQNFPIPDELTTADGAPHREREPLAVYVGGISDIRGIREMVQAMALLPERVNARLALAGRCFVPPELEDEVRRMPGWKRVEFLGWQSRAGMAALLGRARIGLVTLHPTRNHLDSYPVKLFEYMAAGIPVIASDFPLWGRIVGEAGCGLLVDPLDPQTMSEAMLWLLDHPVEAEAMGRRGQEAVRTQYNWETESQKLLRFYDRILCEPAVGVDVASGTRE